MVEAQLLERLGEGVFAGHGDSDTMEEVVIPAVETGGDAQ